MTARLRRAQSLAALLGILLLAIVISPTANDGSRIFLQAGNLDMEKEDELRRCNVTFGQLASATLSPDDSAKLVTTVANQYQDIARSHS